VSDAIKLSSPTTHEFWEIPVVHEDEHLLALDKPARLLTSPDRYDASRPNLMRLLHEGIAAGKPWALSRNLTYLSNAHRLDFETSGVILLAKNKPALVALANLFGSEKPAKKYVALVRGDLPASPFEVDAKLSPHPVKLGMMRVDQKEGKRSLTKFALIEDFPRFTYAGVKLVGDELYGGKFLWLSRLKPGYRLKPGREERPLISRVALHAEELSLVHPVTNENITITAPWPKDFKVAVKYLRQYSIGPGRTTEADEEN